MKSSVLKSPFTETKEGFRKDIQGLRGIAITAVLTYHFLPKYVPYGFLGVDMFFVISGYLISMILTSTSRLDFAALLNFYMRRIKRIVPLYYIVFGSAALLSVFILSYVWLVDNFERFLYALVFLLNVNLYQSNKGYFALNNDEHEIFLNGWSLSVEIQFYLVAPLFFIFHSFTAKRLPRGGVFVSLGLLSMLIIGSQLFPYLYSNPDLTTFYHPLSRISQFASGIVAQLLHQLTGKKKGPCLFHSPAILISVSILIIPLFALPSGSLYGLLSVCLRIMVTIATAVLLFSGAYMTFKPLTNKILRYIGDISYSIYLVHWPVLVFCKYYAKWHNVQESLACLVAFLLSICIAIVLHHLVEKPILKQNSITGCLIAFIMFFALLNIHGHWQTIREGTIGGNSEIINKNSLLMESVYHHKEANYSQQIVGGDETFGVAEFPPGNGTLRVLVLGNSYAAQEVPVIKRLLDGHYARFVIYTVVHNQVLVTYGQAITNTARELVTQMKPHIIFILIRYHDKELQPVTENDSILKEFVQNAEFLQKHADHIFIESPRPVYPSWFISNFMDRLEWNQSMEMTNMNLTESMSEIQYAWLRVNVLLTKCAKCVLLHSDTPFIDKERDIVRMYDPETLLSYVDNTRHLTNEGLKLVENSYRSTVQSVINQYYLRNNTVDEKGQGSLRL